MPTPPRYEYFVETVPLPVYPVDESTAWDGQTSRYLTDCADVDCRIISVVVSGHSLVFTFERTITVEDEV
jgi:hypothetical protein